MGHPGPLLTRRRSTPRLTRRGSLVTPLTACPPRALTPSSFLRRPDSLQRVFRRELPWETPSSFDGRLRANSGADQHRGRANRRIMDVNHLAVSRTARYFALGPEAEAARELWIVLHGHSQLAERFLRAFAPLDDGATRIVAPEALSRFYLEATPDGRHGNAIGATWLTREDREADLDDHLRYLDLLANRILADCQRKPRLVVMGFSQGSVMAARWVARGAVVPDRVILWGTPLPEDVTHAALASRLAGRQLLLVAGDKDPLVVPGSIEATCEALRALGAEASAQRFAGGHQVAGQPLLRAAGRSGEQP